MNGLPFRCSRKRRAKHGALLGSPGRLNRRSLRSDSIFVGCLLVGGRQSLRRLERSGVVGQKVRSGAEEGEVFAGWCLRWERIVRPRVLGFAMCQPVKQERDEFIDFAFVCRAAAGEVA